MDAADDFTENQRLGVRERLGYCLHEVGRFAEARTLNEIVLARGAPLFGQDSPKLMVVLTNLAQSCHELKDMGGARSYLDRWLAIAMHAGATEQIEQALFQEGVLAFETGAPDEARAFMQTRVLVATQSGDAERIQTARQDLDILEQKLRD